MISLDKYQLKIEALDWVSKAWFQMGAVAITVVDVAAPINVYTKGNACHSQ